MPLAAGALGVLALLAAPAAPAALPAPLAPSPLAAQAGSNGAEPPDAEPPQAEGEGAPETLPWRFGVGERAVYDVTFGPVRVGRGRLSVEGVDTVASTPAYRVAFELEGGPFFYKVDDRTVSWVAPDPIRSLLFEQILNEGDYHRRRRYAMDQGAGTYTRQDWDAEAEAYVPHPEERDVPMPPAALDEIAYLYLARSLPLEPGRTYRFERYFEEDGNPVVLEVLRRETVRVPAGRFRTVVVRPTIQTDGLFSEGGRAEVYISDDDRRAIVLLRTTMKVGELNMYLRDYEPGEGPTFGAAR